LNRVEVDAHFGFIPSIGSRSLSTPATAADTAVIFLGQSRSVRAAAALAYRRVVEQARQRVFFVEWGVPDTLDGRFELICLHAFLYLHRLKSERPGSIRLAQSFFDTMFGELDRALRESGTGDLRVGKEVKRMAQGFYGRIRAYEAGLAADDSALGAALARNLFGTVVGEARPVAAIVEYVRAETAALTRLPATELLAGRVRFEPPAPRDASAVPQ
jgi:cytochrome b pre-mRNA-processing protein 3